MNSSLSTNAGSTKSVSVPSERARLCLSDEEPHMQEATRSVLSASLEQHFSYMSLRERRSEDLEVKIQGLKCSNSAISLQRAGTDSGNDGLFDFRLERRKSRAGSSLWMIDAGVPYKCQNMGGTEASSPQLSTSIASRASFTRLETIPEEDEEVEESASE
mmetsp:Transcript_10778/g.28838  ORF Transcript_10778/g.28838 Transcript_10778/m.28838 type:complete len:160 (+) Transcript_10778:29-508(+)